MKKIDDHSPKGTYFFNTSSGSKYFIEIFENGKYLKRTNQKFKLRRDNKEIEIKKIETLEIGKPAVFCLEPLGLGDTTFRFTTDVLDIIDFQGKLSLKAFKVALIAHEGQTDLAGVDYIEHVKMVGKHVKEVTKEDSIIAVAYLHDILEDTEITESELSETFPNEIVTAVKALTKKKNENYQDYLTRVKENEWARLVKLADLQHNMDITRIKNPTKRDLDRIEKYRKAMLFLQD